MDKKIDGDGAARLPMTQHKDYQRNLRRRRRRTEHPPTAMRCARLLDIADIFVTDLGRPAAPHPRAMAGKQVDVARGAGRDPPAGASFVCNSRRNSHHPKGQAIPAKGWPTDRKRSRRRFPIPLPLFTLFGADRRAGAGLHLNLNRQRFDRQVCVNLCKASPGDRTIVLIDFAPDAGAEHDFEDAATPDPNRFQQTNRRLCHLADRRTQAAER